MIVVEHDAKELLAVQGVPMPGGIMLRQVPKYDREGDEPAGPWLIKPQIPDAGPGNRPTYTTARNAREVAEAARQWLGNKYNGHTISAVRVERKLIAAHRAYLSFECDPTDIGIRVSVGFGDAGDTASPVLPDTALESETTVPDPNAVLACAARLADQLPETIRDQVHAAARTLIPLFFGYEAIVLEIDPLMVFEDGSWMVGNVEMQIDENALFRHPELISLMDRRGDSYVDSRKRRELGLDFSVVDDKGNVGLLTNGTALALFLMEELRARKLRPYNYIDLRASRITEGSDCLKTAIDLILAGSKVRTILINLVSGASEIDAIAKAIGETLKQMRLDIPIVIRLAGNDPEIAKPHFDDIDTDITLLSDLEAALELVERQASLQASP